MARTHYLILILLTVLSGVITSVFVPNNILNLTMAWYFAPVMLLPLFLSVFILHKLEGYQASKKYFLRSFFLVYIYGAIVQFFVFYWILDAISLFTDVGGVQTALSFLFICLMTAFYYVFISAPFVFGLFLIVKKKLSFLTLILISLSMTYLEIALPRFFHWTFSQFLHDKVNLIFYSQFLGASFISFFLFFTALLLARTLFLNKVFFLLSCLLSFTIWVLIDNLGTKLLDEKTRNFAKERPKEILISYIQPNIDFSNGRLEKLSFDSPKPFSWNSLEDMSLLSISQAVDKYKKNPDLLVWPESALPFNLSKATVIRERLIELSNKIQLPILIQGTVAIGDAFHSSSFLVKDGQIRDHNAYHKWILMPLGEYVPFEEYIPYFGQFFRENFINIESFLPGKESTTLQLRDDIYFAPLICFDSISELLPREQVISGAASFFVNQTNFIWMGKGNASYEFSVIDRFRAVENGRSLVLVSNSGPVVAYDPFGHEILNEPELLVSGVGSLKLPLNFKKTFYTRYPYLFRVITFCGFIIYLVCLFLYYFKEKCYAKRQNRNSPR